ncbi:MAG: ATP-binding protein [Pseudomonadota bacterium]
MSIKQFLGLASLTLVLLVTGSALLSLLVASSAELRLERAVRSYEQLAIATGLETEALRAMLAELQTRSGGELDDSLFSDRERVASGIDALIARTQEEIGSTDDPDEQAEEAQEFVAAFSLREDYARLFRILDEDRRGDSGLDGATVAQYATLAARLDDVLSDEREEVAAVIADLDALRGRVMIYAVVSVLGAALAVLIAAALFYRFLAEPFRLLESGSSQLASGDISHRIPVLGPPELKGLSVRLNEMAGRLEEQRNALRDSNEHLEDLVAERTEELADKADRLQRIDDSRRLFFAKVGHELRTPLAVLLGEAEVALQMREGTETDYRDALEHISVHGEQLRRRISDLLTLARADDGRLGVELEPLELVDLLRSTADSARGYARVNEVTLRLRAGEAALMARADADRLRQALMALIDNAIKFSPQNGEIELRVDRDGSMRRLEVSDRGPGVAEEELGKITRAYFQGDAQPARAGTGLGLAVAQWIAEQHGGRLDAANRDGGGLSVAILLPADVDTPVGEHGELSLSSAP